MYRYLCLRAGDYWDSYHPSTSEQLFQVMLLQAKRIKETDEAWHFRKQVSYALAAESITSDHGDRLYEAAGMTKEGGFKSNPEERRRDYGK